MTCLPRVLSELSAQDREAITLCAAKSRPQWARIRTGQHLTTAAPVQLYTGLHVQDYVPHNAGFALVREIVGKVAVTMISLKRRRIPCTAHLTSTLSRCRLPLKRLAGHVNRCVGWRRYAI